MYRVKYNQANCSALNGLMTEGSRHSTDNMPAFIASFIFIILAEMGDKTQLLAIAFATKYPPQIVLSAVFFATLINHFLAVIIGQLLVTIIPLNIVLFIAALSFIFFGLWTLKGDELEDENNKKSAFGPFLTVAIAFFIAEMGDKTQLTTISLMLEYRNAIFVLMGTTLAMVLADAFGIIIGVVMKKHIPEKTIKWISACIFILFGFISMHQNLASKVDAIAYFIIMSVVGMAALCGMAYILVKKTDTK